MYYDVYIDHRLSDESFYGLYSSSHCWQSCFCAKEAAEAYSCLAAAVGALFSCLILYVPSDVAVSGKGAFSWRLRLDHAGSWDWGLSREECWRRHW